MLRYEYFIVRSRYAWWITDVNGEEKRVITKSTLTYAKANNCLYEIERVRGKNTDVPIVLLTGDGEARRKP